MMGELTETVSDNSLTPRRGRGRPKMFGMGLAMREMSRRALAGHTERSVRNHERAESVLWLIEEHAPEIAGRFNTPRLKTTVLVALARLPIQWWISYARELVKDNGYTVRGDVRWLRNEYERRFDEIRELDLLSRRKDCADVCIEYRCWKPALAGGDRCRKHKRAMG